MTHQIRKGYRNHRRGAWVAMLALVALIAAAITPLATGAPPKYYTLTASPTTVCYTGAGQPQLFSLTLTNESRNNSLGSANITAPNIVSRLNTLGGAPAGSSLEENTIKLRNLVLPPQGDPITVTVWASIDSIGTGVPWTSVAKQSNDFADAPGPGNLFTLQDPPGAPSLTAAQCSYAFVDGPDSDNLVDGPRDAAKNAPQTVTVELQANGVKVAGSSDLTLQAYQGESTTALAAGVFTGLTATAANGIWSFSLVTGTQSGENYRLKAGDTLSSYFKIADCIQDESNNCNFGFTPNANGDSGASLTGSGIGSSITLSFASIPGEGLAICGAVSPAGWGWSPLTFPPNETTFDGLILSDFSYAGTGYLKLKYYLRNDLYVQTSPSNTNDILICAGGRHSSTPNDTAQGATTYAFMGRGGIKAKYDVPTGLYWGVLERVSNCNKSVYVDNDAIPDPVLCAWGTQDVTFNGVTIKYRTATVLVPADWDWKMGG